MIKIIKNTLIDPIHKTCDECGSEFTFNYDDIQRGSTLISFGTKITHRYVVCPVCKHECSFFKAETEQCDLSKKVEEAYNEN